MADYAVPLDVTLLIMDVSMSKTIATMMRTCRLLYCCGAKILLDRGVSLETSEQVISFLCFMVAQPDDRFPRLRSLAISRGNFSPRAVNALNGLITHKSLSLDSLTMLDAVEILASDRTSKRSRRKNQESLSSPLLRAFSSIATLKHLTIDRCDTACHSLLRNLRSSLVTACLALEPPGILGWRAIDDRNPIVLLTRSSQTLEELTGSGFDIHPDIIKYDAVYPAVRRISATNSNIGTLAYINAFPNLESLSLTSTHFENLALGAEPFLDLWDRRSNNADDQARYGCSWQHLQEIDGHLADLYALGLGMPVPRVRIRDDISARLCDLLTSVLGDLRPQTLIMTAVGVDIFGFDQEISTLLRQPCLNDMEDLELEIRFRRSERDGDLRKYLNCICDTFIALELRHLTLTLNYGELVSSPDVLSPWAKPIHQSLENLDIQAYGDSIARVAKSLEDVTVRLSTEAPPYEFSPAEAMDAQDQASDVSSTDSDEVDEELASLMLTLVSDDEEGW